MLYQLLISLKMRKILFVSSGNSGKIKQVVYNQAQSINEYIVDHFLIQGKGIYGYLKNILPLKRIISSNEYSVIHAHYSFSAFIASLAGSYPLVVSLMGSDVKSGFFYRIMIMLFQRLFNWKYIIVKSEDLKQSLNLKNALVIPNGVDINIFKPLDKIECQKILGWENTKKHILFAANPRRVEKNYKLAFDAISLINDSMIDIHVLENVSYNDMVFFYNASDVIILTSLWEGSPNVIKEAMACNRPIVCTDVGDANWVLKGTEGCYIAEFIKEDVANKIILALEFSKKRKNTIGRLRILDLGLDKETIAKRLEFIYNSIAK